MEQLAMELLQKETLGTNKSVQCITLQYISTTMY